MPETMLTFCKYAGAFAILCGALSKSLLAKNREEELAARTVHFDSRSPEFDRLVGRKPSYEYLATGRADLLGAHEGAVFLEHGSQDSSPILSRSPCLIFTTKPHKDKTGAEIAQVKRLIIDGPRKGDLQTLFTSENLVNGATLGYDGRLYFCFQGGLEATAASGIYSVDPHNCSDKRSVTDSWIEEDGYGPTLNYNSPNDVVARPDGSVWFTDPSYASAQGLTKKASLGEWVWRWDAKSKTSAVVADGFTRPNGLVFSPDGKTAYVTDTGYDLGYGGPKDPAGPRSVYAFDVIKDRFLANRRLIYVADRGIPDGIKVDAQGNIYTGCADGVHVLSGDGVLLGKITPSGENPAANLAFGKGKWRSKLYILDETSVIAVDLPGTRGAPVGTERKSPGPVCKKSE